MYERLFNVDTESVDRQNKYKSGVGHAHNSRFTFCGLFVELKVPGVEIGAEMEYFY